MSVKTLLVLSRDERLVEWIRNNAPGVRVKVATCLNGIRTLESKSRLLIDPRSAGPCCLKKLSSWRHKVLPHQITLLQGTAGSTPPAAGVPADLLLPDPRRAWLERERILAPEGRSQRERHLLMFARRMDHAPCPVPKAAAALALSVRRLDRFCRRTFGFPPGIIIDLARIASVAADLRATHASLKILAKAHGFRDSSALCRQFVRFVGEPPGAHRDRARIDPPSTLREGLSETAKGYRAPFDVSTLALNLAR